MGAGSWETSWISFLVMKTSPLEKLWSASHIPNPHFICGVNSFSSLLLVEKEQIKKQNMTQESVSFAEVATYVRENVFFFSTSKISILCLPWIKGQSAFFVWCRTTSHNVTTQHQRSRAEHNIDMHCPCPCHILQYLYICNLFTCPFFYYLREPVKNVLAEFVR